MTGNERITVLMADDDPEDCMLAEMALAESSKRAAFFCIEDGLKLMDYLAEHSSTEAKHLPNLILLDLNMPGKDGRQALSEIKSKPAFQHIPIVILTTSKEQGDIDYTLKAGAESFITQPVLFAEWIEIMKSLADDWLS